MCEYFNLDPLRLGIGEVFIAKYSAARGKQRRLKAHEDGSDFSFVIALNDGHKYEGGGTKFTKTNEIKRVDKKGSGVTFCGKNKHEGLPVTKGVRYILAGFMRYGDPNGCSSGEEEESESESESEEELPLIKKKKSKN